MVKSCFASCSPRVSVIPTYPSPPEHCTVEHSEQHRSREPRKGPAEDFEEIPRYRNVKRPGNRPFASYGAHDPAGNYFDLSQPGHENRAEVYAKGEWKQETTFSHFAIRARESERLAHFYADVFELEARNTPFGAS
jgi:hypothetical protein